MLTAIKHQDPAVIAYIIEKNNIHVIKKQWGNGAMGKLHQTPPLPTVTALKQEMYGVAKVS